MKWNYSSASELLDAFVAKMSESWVMGLLIYLLINRALNIDRRSHRARFWGHLRCTILLGLRNVNFVSTVGSNFARKLLDQKCCQSERIHGSLIIGI